MYNWIYYSEYEFFIK